LIIYCPQVKTAKLEAANTDLKKAMEVLTVAALKHNYTHPYHLTTAASCSRQLLTVIVFVGWRLAELPNQKSFVYGIIIFTFVLDFRL